MPPSVSPLPKPSQLNQKDASNNKIISAVLMNYAMKFYFVMIAISAFKPESFRNLTIVKIIIQIAALDTITIRDPNIVKIIYLILLLIYALHIPPPFIKSKASDKLSIANNVCSQQQFLITYSCSSSQKVSKMELSQTYSGLFDL